MPAARGGLLFGTTEGDVITIQVFRRFAICDEHETNSRADEQFDKGVEELSAASAAEPELAGLRLIGWCYVRRDGSTGLLDRDAQFHKRHFPHETDVLLVLKPEEQDLSIELFVRTSNAPLSTQEYRCASIHVCPGTPVSPPIEVKLQARSEADSLHEIPAPANREVPANTRALVQAPPSPRKNRQLWVLLAAMLVLAIGMNFAWPHIRARYSVLARDSRQVLGPTSARTILHISVEGRGDGVLLSWDHNATLVRSAKQAILRIEDGPQHRKIYLDPMDIASGSIVYRPGSDDVRFSLGLLGDHGSTMSNTVRMVDGSASTLNSDLPGDTQPAPNSNPETISSPAYVAAQALEQVSPNTKRFAGSDVQEGTEVDVQVRIDEEGRVIEAHVKNGTKDNASLRSAALEAARQWSFKPAKSGGQHVASDHTIVFKFHP